MQSRYLVVEGLPPLVEAPPAVAQQILQQLDADLAALFGQVRGVFQQVQ